MNNKDLIYSTAYVPGADRTEVEKAGTGLRSRVAIWWLWLGFIFFSVGALAVIEDVTHPAFMDTVVNNLLTLVNFQTYLPTFTPYLGVVLGCFCLVWGTAFYKGKDWALLVACWWNGLFALSLLGLAAYLVQVSWLGFRVGSLEISRLWLSLLATLLGLLFGWISLRLLFSAKLLQNYYIWHAQDETTTEINKLFEVCRFCGRNLAANHGSCPEHDIKARLIDQELQRAYPLPSGNVIIGRNSGDISLNPKINARYRYISADHAQIFLDESGYWFLRDLRGKGKTFVGQQPVPRPNQSSEDAVPLDNGTLIKLGDCEFIFETH